VTGPAARGDVAALILAAGRSSRMAPRNKMLIRDDAGRTMIGRVVESALASRAAEVVVVTGHEAAEVEQAARQNSSPSARLRFVPSPDYARGLSASVKAGIAAVDGASAALICLGDMPLVTSAMMDAMIDAFDPDCGKIILVPTCKGERGNPVLWGRDLFPHFTALSGDSGARQLLVRHASLVAEMELGTTAILQDFDTPQSLPLLLSSQVP
jgi:molybdenum cofactor cytidylyltransferase